jgi:hypothetical protein
MRARQNALLLAREVPTVILDHHMLRNEEGYRFLEDLSATVGHTIFCVADYMGSERLPLEAWRQRLFREMPVPKRWHNAYSRGKADTQKFRHWRGIHVEDDRGREI